jgi:hypothetical protein
MCSQEVLRRAGAVSEEQVRDGHTACRHRRRGAQQRDNLADVVFGRQDARRPDGHVGVELLAWLGSAAEHVLPAVSQPVARGRRGEGAGTDGPVVLGLLTLGEVRVQREVSPSCEQLIPDSYADELASAPAGGCKHGPWASAASGRSTTDMLVIVLSAVLHDKWQPF